MPGDIRTGFTPGARKKAALATTSTRAASPVPYPKWKKTRKTAWPLRLRAKFLARVALKRRVKPFYAIGLSYKFFVLLSRVLPIRLISWLLGLLYAGN